MHLKAVFATRKLLDISPDEVESYLRRRMRQRALVKTSLGYREGRPLKPATVHQELRVLRRILNVAVRKRLIPSNPCSGVEFPVAIRGLFRPHYVTWSEQAAHRTPLSRSPAQCRPHHHRNRAPRLQGVDAHYKGASGPTGPQAGRPTMNDRNTGNITAGPSRGESLAPR
jgi:hypothetical protein